jgi:hypothetical protein
LLDVKEQTTEYIVVGGVMESGRKRPYAAVLSVSPDSISVVRDSVYRDEVGYSYWAITEKGSGPSDMCFATGNEWLETTVVGSVVLSMDSDLQVAWRNVLSIPGATDEKARDITTDGTNIFTVGFAVDDNDRCSEVAFAMACEPTGQVLWATTTSPGDHNAGFYSCILADGDLYATGMAMFYYQSASNRRFGYGLLSKIDPTTGAFLNYATYGHPESRTMFHTLLIQDGIVTCAGYTNYYFSGYSCNGYLVEIDLAGFQP